MKGRSPGTPSGQGAPGLLRRAQSLQTPGGGCLVLQKSVPLGSVSS